MAVNYLVGEDLKFSWYCSSGRGRKKKIKRELLSPTFRPHYLISPYFPLLSRRQSSGALSPLVWGLISSTGSQRFENYTQERSTFRIKKQLLLTVHTTLLLLLIEALLMQREAAAAVNWAARWLIAYTEAVEVDLNQTPDCKSFHGKTQWSGRKRHDKMCDGEEVKVFLFVLQIQYLWPNYIRGYWLHF